MACPEATKSPAVLKAISVIVGITWSELGPALCRASGMASPRAPGHGFGVICIHCFLTFFRSCDRPLRAAPQVEGDSLLLPLLMRSRGIPLFTRLFHLTRHLPPCGVSLSALLRIPVVRPSPFNGAIREISAMTLAV